MNKRTAAQIAKAWLGDQPVVPDQAAWRLDQAVDSLSLVPQGTWAVSPATPAGARGQGLPWVGRPLRVLASGDALYELQAYETADRRGQFGIDIRRLLLDGFGSASILMQYLPGPDGSTRARRTWVLKHRDAQGPHRFFEELPTPKGATRAADAVLASELVAMTGWSHAD
jgi:hypothetical protein